MKLFKCVMCHFTEKNEEAMKAHIFYYEHEGYYQKEDNQK